MNTLGSFLLMGLLALPQWGTDFVTFFFFAFKVYLIKVSVVKEIITDVNHFCRWNSWNHFWCDINENIVKSTGKLLKWSNWNYCFLLSHFHFFYLVKPEYALKYNCWDFLFANLTRIFFFNFNTQSFKKYSLFNELSSNIFFSPKFLYSKD